jgi:hypothetical protein
LAFLNVNFLYFIAFAEQVMLYDILESVDGFVVAGWKMEDILRLLVGQEGTPVTLGLRRTVQSPEGLLSSNKFNVTLIRSLRALPPDHVPGTVSVMAVRLFPSQ